MNRTLLLSGLVLLFSYSALSIAPFYKIAEKKASLANVEKEITTALNSANFEIIGTYNVAGNNNFKVIVFTSSKLKEITLSFANRGSLAAAQKISLIHKNGITTISLLNPDYLFHAYFQDNYSKNNEKLTTQINEIMKVFKNQGYSFTPFGGDQSIDDLHDYQYMIGMPEFNDPVKLNSYNSFEEGLKIIRKNLEAKKGNTLKVYELVFPNEKTAVFGVGLLDAEEGEKHFLSIIGEDQLAAMPYEIILQDTKATMLHGRFRFALYWPELTMSTFTKIMSSPGDVEDFMEDITE
ncbi:MAG: hypothetical protein KOO66_09400 [Bacteroidales bacterium]|nr:hypothetical protein [Bacteroidales bacterium]